MKYQKKSQLIDSYVFYRAQIKLQFQQNFINNKYFIYLLYYCFLICYYNQKLRQKSINYLFLIIFLSIYEIYIQIYKVFAITINFIYLFIYRKQRKHFLIRIIDSNFISYQSLSEITEQGLNKNLKKAQDPQRHIQFKQLGQMIENYNQLSQLANNEQNCRNSEIPIITNLVGRLQKSNALKNSVEENDESWDFDFYSVNQTTIQDQMQLQLLNESFSLNMDTNKINNCFIYKHQRTFSSQIEQQNKKPKISQQAILQTVIAIIINVFVSGFKGTAFLMIDIRDSEDETQTGGFILRAFWRQILASIFFIPLIYQEYDKEKKEEIKEMRLYQIEHIFNRQYLKTIIFCSFFSAVWLSTMVYSVFHISIANVYIFNNSYPLFLVIYKILQYYTPKEEKVQQQSINKFEIFGTLLFVTVLFLFAFEGESVFYPYLISLLGAISASIYYTYKKNIRYEYPQMLAIFLFSAFATIIFGVYSLIFEDSTLDMNTSHGLFGVFSFKWIFLNTFISFITGVVNMKVFSFISQQLKTLYIDILIAFEPFTAMILAYFLGYQDFFSYNSFKIYIFYIIAHILLAKGKSESQIQQIHLLDEDSIVLNSNYYSRYSHYNFQNQNIVGLTQNDKNSYFPPSVFTSGAETYKNSNLNLITGSKTQIN
ncbi:transmembrane protein, putative (macronuclear) [Tetrahymena thermophila SB210]|uniref:Transmembrane protein, putative n=1 Tax=Tetrahymena thermophila (strain SB210) TaxID=312017 RepID=I7M642_TETTS|nr:transmembrane protein, putative [Tetrahymena thermophila SB210]EAR84165.2 transmembrane protein, putative [Tetrahymena thermophila SB210]|eukprot:XP_001031828.2 transmembrane protein, putative [Tetrahymena thermophila SB210]